MANKREFKKSVAALSSALVDEMMASYYNVADADREKIADAIAKVVEGMAAARVQSNKMFKKGVREFENLADYNKAKALHTKEKYRAAIDRYNDAVNEALKAYNEGMPKNAEGK